MKIEDYTVHEQIYSSDRTKVYRCIKPDNSAVIIKSPNLLNPTLRIIASYQWAFDLACLASPSSVIKHLELLRLGGSIAMVMEDIGAVSLSSSILRQGIPLDQWLRWGSALATSLGKLHESGIIHNNLNPSNIIINPQTEDVRLIDMSCSFQLRRESSAESQRPQLIESLAYKSPEQCGRLNVAVDNRSDLYSLGVILYELATGKLPFPFDSPAELAHAHAARSATQLSIVRPEFPQVVSDIVDRLLSKNLDDRYASAQGLSHDLTSCLRDLEWCGTVRNFTLGRSDASSIFRIPDRLYGRDSHTKLLLEAIDNVKHGSRVFVAISGLSGMGKTALMHELERLVSPSNLLVVSGKYDQFAAQPYDGILKAIRSLLRYVFADSTDQELASLRNEIQNAVGIHGQLLTSAIPELRSLLAPQPELESVPPEDASRRLNLLLGRFLAVFTNRDRPVLLFLDDMQWADRPSLALLEAIVSNSDLSHLILALGYRSNEVDSLHPIIPVLHAMQNSTAINLDLQLNPLTTEDVIQLLADTLHTTSGKVQSLGTELQAMSSGIPFVISEFLYALHERSFFKYILEDQAWHWELERLHDFELPQNVAFLIAQSLNDLPKECVDLLSTASCIGSEFDLITLSYVEGINQTTLAAKLAPAVRRGILIPVDAYYKVFESLERWDQYDSNGHDIGTASYRFQHDQVRERVHAWLDSAQMSQRHLQIGRLLKLSLSEAELEQRLIEVFTHVAIGAHLLTQPDEKQQFARLGLLAGQRALRGLAFERAREMLTVARQLLPATAWLDEYETAMAIQLALAQCAYALMLWDEFDDLSRTVIERSIDTQHSAEGHGLTIRVRNIQKKYDEAVDIGIQVAGSLGVKLPRHPRLIHVLLWVTPSLLDRVWRKPLALTNLDEARNPRARAAISILASVINSAYFAEPNLLPIISLCCSRLTIRYGATPQSAYGFAVWGLVLCGVFGQIDAGYNFGMLALNLGQRYRGVEEARAKFVVDSFIRHWMEPLPDVADHLDEDWNQNRDRGDAETATYSAGTLLCAHFLSGQTLDTEIRYSRQIDYLFSDAVEHVKDCFLAWAQLGVALTVSPLPERLMGNLYTPADSMPLVASTTDPVQIAVSSIATGIYEHLAGRFDSAEMYFATAARLESSLVSQMLIPGLVFFRGLNAYRLAERGRVGMKALRVARNQRSRLRRWAKFAPVNLSCRLFLLDAEEQLVCRKPVKALQALIRAYEHASDGALMYKAMAQSRLASIYTLMGSLRSAEMASAKAAEYYSLWGSPALAAAADRSISNRINHQLLEGRSEFSPLEAIDLKSIFHTVATISSVIDETTLLSQLMPTLIQTAGADRGVMLLLDEQERLWIEAETNLGETLLTRCPLDEFPMLSHRSIALALRSPTPVVIQDVRNEHLLTGESYSFEANVASILAMAIHLQSRTIGVIYLENHLARGSFTPNRVEVTRALAVQAGIALDNARLYGRIQSALDTQTVLSVANRRFVPEQFLSGLGFDSIVDVNLNEAVERDMNVIFIDLRGFSQLSVKLGPRGSISLINRYLSHVQPGIAAHGGFVAQYYGDGILALFPEGVEKALRGAIAMCRGLEGYNQNRGDAFPELNFGIGLHYGCVTLGTIGDQDHFQCTVVGDTVNVASRLEGLTKYFGCRLVLSASTLVRVEYPEQFSFRPLGRVQVQGREEAFDVFECLACYPDHLHERISASSQSFLDGLAAYRSGDWGTASAAFAACIEVCDEDKVAHRFAQRCLERSQADAPWDGLERPRKG